jgi:hypothetical protein
VSIHKKNYSLYDLQGIYTHPRFYHLVVWGWSVNDKKARIRDVGVVNLKDTPRKVVWHRTPAQMVNFRIFERFLRNYLMIFV